MWGKIFTVAILPVYQVRNAAAYAGARPTWREKVLTFANFLPTILITTLLWAGAWALVLRLAWYLLSRLGLSA